MLTIAPSRSWIKAANGLFRVAFYHAHENVIRNAAVIVGRWE
jgi:hypothetical protein